MKLKPLKKLGPREEKKLRKKLEEIYKKNHRRVVSKNKETLENQEKHDFLRSLLVHKPGSVIKTKTFTKGRRSYISAEEMMEELDNKTKAKLAIIARNFPLTWYWLDVIVIKRDYGHLPITTVTIGRGKGYYAITGIFASTDDSLLQIVEFDPNCR